MPSKIQLDENLWFLYICLQKSDLKSIDFAAVGAATSLKPPAARMRYTRLRRQIESGTLIGTHGTPFLSSSSTSPTSLTSTSISTFSNQIEKENGKKRKRGSGEGCGGVKVERDGGMGYGGLEETGEKGGVDGKIKEESRSDDEFESASEGWDSEDEVPLAKLRKTQLPSSIQRAVPTPSASYGYAGGNVNGAGAESRRVYEGVQGRGYVPVSEGRAWTGMIPVGNVGLEDGYPAYWNGFSGVGAWEQGGKPRKSV
ncbi:hypothetical protein V8E51_015422 [Hyaloscypha variabilis]